MVVAHIVGGLGNQLFQYAAARRLARKHQTTLKLHLGEFEVYLLHLYGLHHLHISAQEVTPQELNRFFPPLTSFLPYTLRTNVARWLPGHGKIMEEKSLAFDPEVLTLGDNVYLRGFWQSEKYFQDCESVIRKEYIVRTPADKQNHRMMDKILHSNAISLHVRRGDYAADPVANRIHGVCDLAYYHQAIAYMVSHVKDPVFYLFSDDPYWAKEHIKPSAPVVAVDFNGPEKNYEDLRLMMHCRHHIIANSTFSWWGAWLNPNKKKIVVAPKRWFADPSRDSRDIVPARWVQF